MNNEMLEGGGLLSGLKAVPRYIKRKGKIEVEEGRNILQEASGNIKEKVSY